MTIRVDKKLKLAFNKASKAFSGSTCSAIEYIMAAYVGAYQQQQIDGVYPTLTMNPISIGEIKIERNLRERRKVVVDPKRVDNCMIGTCGRPAVDAGTFNGKTYKLCSFHVEGYAGVSGWVFP